MEVVDADCSVTPFEYIILNEADALVFITRANVFCVTAGTENVTEDTSDSTASDTVRVDDADFGPKVALIDTTPAALATRRLLETTVDTIAVSVELNDPITLTVTSVLLAVSLNVAYTYALA